MKSVHTPVLFTCQQQEKFPSISTSTWCQDALICRVLHLFFLFPNLFFFFCVITQLHPNVLHLCLVGSPFLVYWNTCLSTLVLPDHLHPCQCSSSVLCEFRMWPPVSLTIFCAEWFGKPRLCSVWLPLYACLILMWAFYPVSVFIVLYHHLFHWPTFVFSDLETWKSKCQTALLLMVPCCVEFIFRVIKKQNSVSLFRLSVTESPRWWPSPKSVRCTRTINVAYY